jgi:transcription elongation factor Elf1
MKCNLCNKEMSISEGIIDSKDNRYHIACKKQYNIELRKVKGLDHNY